MMIPNYRSVKSESELRNNLKMSDFFDLSAQPSSLCSLYLSLLPFDGKVAATAPDIMSEATDIETVRSKRSNAYIKHRFWHTEIVQWMLSIIIFGIF